MKSQVKHNNTESLSSSFICNIGVRQGDCLSPLLFSMCLNDLEDELRNSGVQGIVTDLIHLFFFFLILYHFIFLLSYSTAHTVHTCIHFHTNILLQVLFLDFDDIIKLLILHFTLYLCLCILIAIS